VTAEANRPSGEPVTTRVQIAPPHERIQAETNDRSPSPVSDTPLGHSDP
jgi:hypothetical protein